MTIRPHRLVKTLTKSGPSAAALSAGAAAPEYALTTEHLDYYANGWLVDCEIRCHEISEWLAVVNYPSLFDELPSRVYAYTGGTDPDDARHRIARRVEELCFRRV